MEASDRNHALKNDTEKLERKFFFRQLLICSGTWTCYFMLGLCGGSTTVLVPQLRREANSTAAVSEEMASWLPATLSYSGLPWVFILPLMIRYMGRKIPQIIVCTTTLVGFTVFFCSKTLIHIIISEILQGALTAAFLTISIIIITEYTSSKYRGMFLTIKSASYTWGVLVSNTIGTFFYWKIIGLLGIICSVYCITTAVFWPESPYWLAAKGRFEDCSAAHRWLKGCNKGSESELEKLINFNSRVKTTLTRNSISKLYKIIFCKQFYKPILLCLLVLSLNVFTGKFICHVYAIDIFKKITKSESTAYNAMLILDGITVISMYIGCGLARLLKRRIMLLVTSSIGIGFIFSMSLYLYLIKLEIICENKYVSILLLSGYSISIGSGPTILASSISGELLPLHGRSVAICILAFSFQTTCGSFIKVSPYMFKSLGLHGTFLFYSLSSLTSLILIYIYLPETKDKTLQEICDCIMGRESKNVAETKKLMALNGQSVSIEPAKTSNLL